eukprot:135129-Pleurochrysis_carterae.AAC.1
MHRGKVTALIAGEASSNFIRARIWDAYEFKGELMAMGDIERSLHCCLSGRMKKVQKNGLGQRWPDPAKAKRVL